MMLLDWRRRDAAMPIIWCGVIFVFHDKVLVVDREEPSRNSREGSLHEPFSQPMPPMWDRPREGLRGVLRKCVFSIVVVGEEEEENGDLVEFAFVFVCSVRAAVASKVARLNSAAATRVALVLSSDCPSSWWVI